MKYLRVQKREECNGKESKLWTILTFFLAVSDLKLRSLKIKVRPLIQLKFPRYQRFLEWRESPNLPKREETIKRKLSINWIQVFNLEDQRHEFSFSMSTLTRLAGTYGEIETCSCEVLIDTLILFKLNRSCDF